MRIKLKTYAQAYIIGFLSYAFLLGLREGYGYYLISTGLHESAELKDYFPGHVISIFLLIIPGYLVGWHSLNRGTVTGLIVVFICHTLSFFSLSIKWTGYSFHYSTLLIWLETSILPSVVGAVCGAAGELHSRKRKLITNQWS
jgi:hypothetical protein